MQTSKQKVKNLQDLIEDLQDLIKIQCSDGNWNYDPYMQGLANGLILAEHLLSGREGIPEFKAAPEIWLKDLPRFWTKLRWKLFGLPKSSIFETTDQTA